ncbi:MAG: pyridoxamine 5-phosphate oxidase family protein [Pseudonocardiales bacterium]|jgi:pyridoxamine 5'-phosphate oxidase family protein|nr:class F420-dependent oxidoreductase [Pseudonocardia sp.]MDT7652292.1 pyridoxamine 5-phosphate oxidase family protein [Pseudonocardiales bacterium]
MPTVTSIFTPAELAYLRGQRLARLATIGPDGAPQVRPVGFLVDAENGTVDIPGLQNPSTQKWRNVVRDGRVALVVDDVVPEPWQPRALEIRGTAETLPDVMPTGAFSGVKPGVIRIHPERILVFGLDDPDSPGSRRVRPA